MIFICTWDFFPRCSLSCFQELSHHGLSPVSFLLPLATGMVVSDPDSFLITEKIVVVSTGLAGSIFHSLFSLPLGFLWYLQGSLCSAHTRIPVFLFLSCLHEYCWHQWRWMPFASQTGSLTGCILFPSSLVGSCRKSFYISFCRSSYS